MRRLSSRESFGCMEFFDFAVLSDGVKSDSGSGGSGNHSLTEEKSEKTRIVGEKNRGKPTWLRVFFSRSISLHDSLLTGKLPAW